MKTLGLAFLTALMIFPMMSFGQDTTSLREEYKKLADRGLWKDVVTFYENKLSPVSDEKSGEDLSKAVGALNRLNEWAKFDDLVEKAVTSHSGNSQVLQAAAESYQSVPQNGSIIGGKFERGWSRSGGVYVNTQNRDRVRSMQLLLESLKHTDDNEVKGNGWSKLASTLLQQSNEWKLQLLTPLDQLPEWDAPAPSGRTEGAPWDGDGPVLYGIPKSWEAAKNDGERWRYALWEWSAKSPETAVQATLALANFSKSQFGEDTLNGYGWASPQGPEEEKSALALDTLADDEVLAKTSDGVRRFKLPPDWHYIALYRSILDAPKVGEDVSFFLAQTYLARRQFVKAQEVLEALIAKHGPGTENFRQKLLDQITGNWGRFGIAETVEKGRHPRIPLLFRNAKGIKLKASPVNMEAVIEDAMTYLKGNPRELDRELFNPSAVANRILEENQSKYVGAPETEWSVALVPEEMHRNTRSEIEVPMDKPGAWWISAEMEGGNRFNTMVWIVDSVIVQRDVADQKQWWVADASDGSPIEGAEVRFFGYQIKSLEKKTPQDRRFNIETASLVRTSDVDGRTILKAGDLDPEYQWMAMAKKEGRAISFFGFQSYYFRDFSNEHGNRDVSYGITDRPLYKPGDQFHAKFFLRNVGYFEPNETQYANLTGELTLFNGRGEEALKVSNLKTDDLGSVEAEVVIPKDAVLGNWQASFIIHDRISASVVFRVEEYRKPEYEVTVEAPSEPIKLGDKFTALVKATYFHGAPVREADVEVIVKRSALSDRWFPMWRWDWLYGKGAWWPGTDSSWHPGWAAWSCMPPPRPWMGSRRWTPEEVVMREHIKIGPDGTAKIEIDTAKTLATQGDMDAQYSIEVRVVDASRREERGTGSVIAARKPFQVVTWTDRGYATAGQEVEAKVSAATLTGKPVANAEGSLKLWKLSLNEEGKVVETEASSWQVKTNAEGMIIQKFPAPAEGQYRLAAELSLAGGEVVSGAFILNVFGTGRAEAEEWKFGPLELITDKVEYAPGETVKLRVNSDKADANVWLFFSYNPSSKREPKRIKLDGKSLEFEVPLELWDMPNMFVEAMSVHGAKLHTAVREILLPPVNKMIDVTVEPAASKVGPGAKSSLKFTLKDEQGNPVVGKAALTVYDKALEAITGGPNSAPMKTTFWSWKNYYYGRSSISLPPAAGNLVRYKDAEMLILSGIGRDREEVAFYAHDGALEFESIRPRSASARGGGIGMGLSAGEPMMDRFSAPAPIALAKQSVENQVQAAGAAPVAIRKDFADLLKWSGEVTTDAAGVAEVPLEFPDNLTTWKARVWVLVSGSRVGEGTAEIITSKDLLVRLQAPRFLVERDEAVLSAVVHNEHAMEKEVTVSLELDGANLSAIDGKPSIVKIPAHGETRMDWKVKALAEGTAKIRMRAETEGDGDAVERELPIVVHGMARQDAWSRVLAPDAVSMKIPFEVPDKLRPEETRLTVRFSPTTAGAVVDAIPYLANYPYGCTEQTLNRFIPTVIAQKMLADLQVNLEEIQAKRTNLNPQELGDAKMRAGQWKHWKENPVFSNTELKVMVKAGLEKLTSMQNSDGGWGWFSGYGEQSYPHTTAVVVHGLLTGKAAGAPVPEEILTAGVKWLTAYEDGQIEALKRYVANQKKRDAGEEVKSSNLLEKPKADAIDAFIREVLGRAGDENVEMVDFLYRDRVDLPAYAKALLGLELHRLKDTARRDEMITLISQIMKRDEENQTAYLDLKNTNYWWYWYGSEVEANAWYLKLLTAVKPEDADTRGLVKYLVNNRRGGYYWNSTRDTAYAIEAIAGYMKASKEDAPEMEVEILVDGKSLKKVAIQRDNLFSFDGTLTLSGKEITPGKHEIEIRRTGKGVVYANAYLEVFSLEDRLREAGLEVKVQRKISKIIETDKKNSTVGKSGQIVSQLEENLKREPLVDGAALKSGDRIEVELILESKNDYEYLIFSDAKAAGFEAVDALSGYLRNAGLDVYMEPRDKTVDFFIRSLPRGTHSIRYLLRAETPGIFKALPAKAEAMYAPELRGNSADFSLQIR